MSLKEYVEKRNFTQTTEPQSGESAEGTLRFVVQRHHASHLHYDFRLELDGVLKSWAVPKGPSLNPKDKRLAMMVEDHPFDYRKFEGIIPNGNYGAGVVMIWDEGNYQSLAEKRADDVKTLRAGLKAGNLKFQLNGNILKGEFALVKLHNADDNAWLLIKHSDEYATPGKYNIEDSIPPEIKKLRNNKDGLESTLPGVKKKLKSTVSASTKPTEPPDEPGDEKAYTPMLAKLETKLVDNADWLYERKLDGYRAIGYTGGRSKLISRNGINFSHRYKKITEALKTIDRKAILDGELVIEDSKGKSHFQDIQHYEGDMDQLVLKYYVFDLLKLDEHDIRHLPLLKRKELLKVFLSALPKGSAIIYNGHVKGQGASLFKKAQKEGWEGIIGKDADSLYHSGQRSASWLKFKLQNSQEALICGYTHPGGARKHFGALILGINDGAAIKYIGNCGTGFSDAGLDELFNKLKPLQTTRQPFAQKVHQHTKITWVKPQLICEVYFTEWTADGHLRHPVYKGLRLDKNAQKVVMETPEKQAADEETISYGNKKLKITHLNKIFWKNEGISKGDLINYYREMAPHIIPYTKDKPISMKRQPNGADDPGFFQKDVDPASLPQWIKTAKMYAESADKYINYIIGNDEATLIYLVNLGCIEINPWLSSYKKPENPDFLVIDLDPHDVPFTWVVETALKTKAIFDLMEVETFIKTSGSKGLHIYCYTGAKYDYDFVRLFAEQVAGIIQQQLPETTSIERTPAKRKNRIYIDFLQNRYGQTIACPYSVRPRPGATVATPLHWHEVNNSLKLSDFTIHTVIKRIKQIDNPWQDITAKKADLKKALKLLKNK